MPAPNPSGDIILGGGWKVRHHKTEKWMNGISRKPTIPKTAANRARIEPTSV
ncbi:uncharacterized protein METZ01_LOCUS246610 [marine metagenome]|uniref:Uncharacterized protein n=1 Tax=marine metagenome TaxID=408172 RepID=A0A382I2C2_9ZZZZ